MNKNWLYYMSLFLVAIVLVWLPHAEQTQASSDGYIYWGDVQTAQYAPLHAYTLNWSGDVLDRGGMSLSTLKQTTSSSEADIVINQYGAFGARSVVKLNQTDLQERTSAYQQGSLQSITMSQGDIYLITLSDGKYAKVSIDEISTTKVSFSFVIETEQPATTSAPTGISSPTATSTGTPAPTYGSATPATQEPVSTSTPAPTASPAQDSEEGKSEPIILTIGQQQAFIKGKAVELQQAPIVKNGTTLVPLRFIAESIGAKVDWNSKQQSITLQLSGKTIILVVNSKYATINGKPIELPTAPIVQNGTTLVPIRFISENFDMDVAYSSVNKQVTIAPKGQVGPPASTTTPPSSTVPPSPSTPPAETEALTFYGEWNLRVEGGALNIYNPSTGEYIGHKYSAGADGGTLSINKNGTYTLKTYAVTQTGTWRPAAYNEVAGYEDGIILEAGSGAEAWAMYHTPSGKTALAQDSGGTYTDGSVIWIIQFIAE